MSAPLVDKALAAGEPYEAHQSLRMLFSRHCARRQVDRAMNLAAFYGPKFAGVGAPELAVDLAGRILVQAKESNLAVSQELVGRILYLLIVCGQQMAATDATDAAGQTEGMGKGAGTGLTNLVEERRKISTRLLAWLSAAVEASEAADAEAASGHSSKATEELKEILELTLCAVADSFLRDGNVGGCQHLLVQTSDAQRLLDMYRSWDAKAYASEKSLMFLRLVLILLAMGRVETAGELVMMEKERQPQPPPAPHQVAFLLWAATQLRDASLFEWTTQRYALVMRRDAACLNHLAQIVLAKQLGKAQPQAGGLMGLLSSMMGAPAAGGAGGFNPLSALMGGAK